MNKKQNDFINLLFNKDESICVSNSKFAYHSINISDLNNTITLVSPNEKTFQINNEQIISVAINPINGFRRDENITAYRTFLIELDDDLIQNQYKYIKELQVPYSACVFSGNKSLHYAITLKEDLINRQSWQFYNDWILNIIKKADQQNKNPSRSIRFPDNIRPETNKKQLGLEIKRRIDINELVIWLNKFPNEKPIPKIPLTKIENSGTIQSVPNWVKTILENGIYTDRNTTWFKVAAALASCNFSYDDTIAILEQFYEEESDFKHREWINVINSAFKRVYGNHYH